MQKVDHAESWHDDRAYWRINRQKDYFVDKKNKDYILDKKN